jgi:hypothetical protein
MHRNVAAILSPIGLVAAGNIGLAARALWLTLKMEFQKGVLWLEEKWID